MFGRPQLILILALGGLSHSASASPPISVPTSANVDWVEAARRLTGESARVRTDSIGALRKIPDLEFRLRSALATGDRYLAFDAIVALELKSLVPDLISFSATDSSGYSYHALNAVASGPEMRRVLGIYRARLEESELRPAAKVAILDSFARTAIEIPGGTLDRLLQDSVPEVRESVLGYLRSSVIHHRRGADVSRVARGLSDVADAIRWRALSILSEVPKGMRKVVAEKIAPAFAGCREDPDVDLRGYCIRVAGDFAR